MSQAYLSGVHAIVLEQGLGKARTKILTRQLESKGGKVVTASSSGLTTGATKATTHVIVGSGVRLSRALQLLKVPVDVSAPAATAKRALPQGMSVVRAEWLSACLVKGERLDPSPYLLSQEEETPSASPSPTKSSTKPKPSLPDEASTTVDSTSAAATENSSCPATTRTTSTRASVSSSPSKASDPKAALATDSSPHPLPLTATSPPPPPPPPPPPSTTVTARDSPAAHDSSSSSGGKVEAVAHAHPTSPPLKSTKSPPKSYGNVSRRWLRSHNRMKTAGSRARARGGDSDSDYIESEEEEEKSEERVEGCSGIGKEAEGAEKEEERGEGEEDMERWEEEMEGMGEEEGEKEEGGSGREEVSTASLPPKKKKRVWACDVPSSLASTNHNKHITDKLEELLTVYKNGNDRWRALSCAKAINAVKKHPKEITTFEEARNIRSVGERLAQKIWEIISSGNLRRLANIDQGREGTLALFSKVHGVGPTTAQQFYTKGYRTLDDLKESGVLNRQQLIGLKHFHDFQERMSRSEVEEIEAKVCEVVQSIVPGMEVVTCGSYRRGKQDCGDIDTLITHPDGKSHQGVFSVFLQKCHEIGFFTDDLSIHDDPVGQCKYLGVCRLPGENRKYRRIDIFIVPYSQYFCALVHFTGNSYFNRSLRSKADKMGMSLSEHSLNTGVVRKNGVKVFAGTPLPINSEQDIFKYLDTNYLEPTDRNQ